MAARDSTLHSTIVIHVDGAITTAGVRARVDGHDVVLTLPSTAVPVPAGRHDVEVEGLQGFVTPFGETRMQIDVPAGRRIDVYYALPRTHLSEGHLGTSPQQRSWGPNWRNIVIAFGGALLLFCLCGVGVAVWQALLG